MRSRRTRGVRGAEGAGSACRWVIDGLPPSADLPRHRSRSLRDNMSHHHLQESGLRCDHSNDDDGNDDDGK